MSRQGYGHDDVSPCVWCITWEPVKSPASFAQWIGSYWPETCIRLAALARHVTRSFVKVGSWGQCKKVSIFVGRQFKATIQETDFGRCDTLESSERTDSINTMLAVPSGFSRPDMACDDIGQVRSLTYCSPRSAIF